MNTEAIKRLLEIAEATKGAYFWNPPCHAAARREMEKRYTTDRIVWHEGGHSYEAQITCKVSVHNVYIIKAFARDGRKTTITAIRNSYNRITQEKE